MVVAATLAAPVERLQERLEELHRGVPMTGARLLRETWHPGPPPELLIVDGDPLDASGLVARFDLAADPPVRVVAGSGGARLAVACHHAAFDGQSLVTLLAALVRPGGPPTGPVRPKGPEAPPPPSTGVVDSRERRVPELRGLAGRLVLPADRVAPSLARPLRDSLAVTEVGLSGPGVTARVVAAAVAAAGAHNARLGRPWRRIGVNVGLAGLTRDGGDQDPGNRSRYRRIDLRAGEPVGPALDAALARNREPLDQVWSPRLGWVLEPVVRWSSDSLLVSNLGRREVPGVTRLEFFPVARGRSAVAVGAVGLAGGPATVSVRARDLSLEDARALLAGLVERLASAP